VGVGETSERGGKRLYVFERYLTLWVGLCIVAGVAVGKALPWLTDALRNHDDEGGLRGRAQRGAAAAGAHGDADGELALKPFSMALIGWLFFRVLFASWIGPAEASQYIAGVIILAAAPCGEEVSTRACR
jgi:ACR3 family arsenite transporter